MKVSDYIAQFIRDKGIKHVFAISGGGAMHLVDSFGNTEGLQYVAMQTEQAAAMAAEGYTRITNLPGCVLVTTGPGGTNALTGVAGAWIDSIPMIVISGQVTLNNLSQHRNLRQFGIQEINIAAIARTVTKWACTVTARQDIRITLEKAWEIATSDRPGPVWIDVPLDVQGAEIDPDRLDSLDIPTTPSPTMYYDGFLATVVTEITESKRPVLIYGYGVRLAGAEVELRRLAQQFKVPIVSSWTAGDILGHEECHIGHAGIMGDRASNFAVQQSDLLLIIGSRMSIPHVGYDPKLFAPNAKQIIVDIDINEADKPSLNPYISIQCDAKMFITTLLNYLESGNIEIYRPEWYSQCQQWKEKYKIIDEHPKNPNPQTINTYHFVELLQQCLADDAIVVTDMGASFTCTHQTLMPKVGQRLFTSSGLAPMGWGLPGAIGAHYASGKPVICVVGDGGLSMNVQELQTIKHYQLPIKILVLNNKGYLTIKHMQDNQFKRRVGSDSRSGYSTPQFNEIACAYGIKSRRVSDRFTLKSFLPLWIEGDQRPMLIELMADPEQSLHPKLASETLPDGTFQPGRLDNMWPFLKEKQNV
jgi:acetolactate synthase-1/2/3 large subunit